MNVPAKFITVLPVVMVAAWMATKWEGPWTPTRCLGLALILLGLAVATLARIQFEREHVQNAGLVTHGVYRRVRHPIYIFSSVAFAGLLLFLDQPLGLLGLLLMEIIVYRLARREEHELEARYGHRYRQYRQQTWM